MSNYKKKFFEYVHPKVESERVYMEEGITSGSVVINPGDQNNSIQIEDWSPEITNESEEGASRW